jgi:isopentenyl diphosphate isomerase/L-lactate dehydrogenase-like FMN-dependent dehydrogenase
MPKSIEEIQTLGEIMHAAHDKLSREHWDYLTGGAETETTLLRNRQSIDEIAFRPRVLNDVSSIDTSAEFLGQKRTLPIVLGPIGSAEQLDPEGMLPAAKAAADFGVGIFKSSVAVPDIEEAAEKSDAQLIFQLYVRGDEDWINEHVDRVEAAGYAGFCLTVDTAIYGRRERDKVKAFTPTQRSHVSGVNYQRALNWGVVERLRKKTSLPLVLKGIATAEDAKIAVEHGVDVIYISNHGGRQLDHGRGAIDVLPEVANAIGDQATVIVDGGFYHGTDILKAIALGANAVGLGRLYGYGLAAYGQAGVKRVLEILETEITSAMGLLSVTALDQLSPKHLHSANSVRPASLTSAFQLFDVDDGPY